MSGNLKVVTLALVLCSAVLLAACGSSGSDSSSTSGATEASSESTEASSEGSNSLESKFIDGYSGPESKFPTSYEEPEKKSGTSFTVGFINPNASIESLTKLEKAVEEQTENYGGQFIAKDSRLDVDREVSNFEQLLAQDVNAIVCYPIDPRALGPSLEKAKKQGVAVIGIDLNADTSTPPVEGFSSQLTLSRDYGSFLAAKTMSEAEPNAEVGIITIAAPVPAFAFQVERLEAYGEEDGLKIVGVQKNSNDQTSGATQAMNSLLSSSPGMTGTFAYNDLTGLTAAGAARAANREVKVISFNGEAAAQEAIEEGALLGTYMIDWVGVGSQAVIAAYDEITEQNLPLPKLVVRPGWMITQEDAAEIPTLDEQLEVLASSE